MCEMLPLEQINRVQRFWRFHNKGFICNNVLLFISFACKIDICRGLEVAWVMHLVTFQRELQSQSHSNTVQGCNYSQLT